MNQTGTSCVIRAKKNNYKKLHEKKIKRRNQIILDTIVCSPHG